MNHWFYADDGKSHGPVSTEELLSFLRTRDGASILVWRAGFEGWRPAPEVPDLWVPPTPSPPPVPPDTPPSVATEEKPSRSRKQTWTALAALIGLLVTLLNVVRGGPLSSDTAFLVGYFSGGLLICTIVGFIAGAIADAMQGPPKRLKIPQRQAPTGKNVVTRHWRGELPLWASYWLIVFCGNLAILIAMQILVQIVKPAGSGNPYGLFALLVLVWVVAIAILTWQLVGVWRSARRYRTERVQIGKQGIWSYVAQVAVVLALVSSCVTFARQGWPQLTGLYRIAFQGDPELPNYSIRVMRDGTEAEIGGGFKFGLTDDFSKILAASPRIRVVHLDSLGGRLAEGEKMFNLIRARGLDTYVSAKCFSACTLAFAGGRKRYLHTKASLGFHRGAFPGVRENEFDGIQRGVLRQAGFTESFISKALSTPHSGMWKPTAQELMSAKVVTAIATGSEFAYSGFGADLTKDKIAEQLAKAVPVFEALRVKFPEQYGQFIDQVFDNIAEGKTETETIAALRAQLVPFMHSVIVLADDDVLADYSVMIADQYRDLNAKHPTFCYLQASGNAKVDVSRELSPAIMQRELAIQERALRTAAKRAQAAQKTIESLWAKVNANMVANGATDTDFAVLQSTDVPKENHSRYCAIATVLMSEIGKLPRAEAAVLMRNILSQGNR